MEKKCKGVSYGSKKIACLFFSDDGLLISKEQIEYLIKIARKYEVERKVNLSCII